MQSCNKRVLFQVLSFCLGLSCAFGTALAQSQFQRQQVTPDMQVKPGMQMTPDMQVKPGMQVTPGIGPQAATPRLSVEQFRPRLDLKTPLAKALNFPPMAIPPSNQASIWPVVRATPLSVDVIFDNPPVGATKYNAWATVDISGSIFSLVYSIECFGVGAVQLTNTINAAIRVSQPIYLRFHNQPANFLAGRKSFSNYGLPPAEARDILTSAYGPVPVISGDYDINQINVLGYAFNRADPTGRNCGPL